MKRKKKKFLYNTEIHGILESLQERVSQQNDPVHGSSRKMQMAKEEGEGYAEGVNGLRAIEDRL